MDIVAAIATGTKAIEVLKAIKDINKSFDDATWKGKVAELISDIADMKIALTEANDKVITLEKEKQDLLAKVIFKSEKTIYESGWLYEVFDDGKIAELPFCQSCTTDGNYVRISYAALGQDKSMCPRCKTLYDTRRIMHR